MNRVSWLRKNHKWLALLAGVQILIWSVSGLYMTFVDLDIIHGDHLVKAVIPKPIDVSGLQPLSDDALKELFEIDNITLENHFDRTFYIVKHRSGTAIFDGATGRLSNNITKESITGITKQLYRGDAAIQSIELLASYPEEIRQSNLPIWRVAFDDLVHSTLYFHHQTGQLISKRTDLWRVFDFLWKLHIVEYPGLDGYRGLLFRILSLLSLAMAVLGLFLLYYRLNPGVK